MARTDRTPATKDSTHLVTGFAVIFVLCLLLAWPITYRVAGTDEVTFTVARVENVKHGDKSKYLVFTSAEVFEVSDTVVFGRWDSSDTYGQLEVGKKYRGRVAGWRVPVLSMYRNIIEVTPAAP